MGEDGMPGLLNPPLVLCFSVLALIGASIWAVSAFWVLEETLKLSTFYCLPPSLRLSGSMEVSSVFSSSERVIIFGSGR